MQRAGRAPAGAVVHGWCERIAWPVADGVEQAVVADVAVGARGDGAARGPEVGRDDADVQALHRGVVPAHRPWLIGRVHELVDEHVEVARQVGLVVAPSSWSCRSRTGCRPSRRRCSPRGSTHRGRQSRRGRCHGAIETRRRERDQRRDAPAGLDVHGNEPPARPRASPVPHEFHGFQSVPARPRATCVGARRGWRWRRARRRVVDATCRRRIPPSRRNP
jgi:hypothetical protein